MKIEVGKAYETRDGCLVRVICTDAKCEYPVVGLRSLPEREVLNTWTTGGRYDTNEEDSYDLVREHVPVTYRWYRVFEHKEVGMAWEKSFVNAPTDIGLIKLAFDPSGNLVIDKCEITGAQPNG